MKREKERKEKQLERLGGKQPWWNNEEKERTEQAQKQGTIRKRSRDEQREDEVRKGRENGEEKEDMARAKRASVKILQNIKICI